MAKPQILMRVAYALGMGLLLTLTGGCGQKGPLYLPDQGGDVVTRPGPAQPAQTPQSPETAPQPSTQPTPPATPPRDPEKDEQTQPPR